MGTQPTGAGNPIGETMAQKADIEIYITQNCIIGPGQTAKAGETVTVTRKQADSIQAAGRGEIRGEEDPPKSAKPAGKKKKINAK